jgi:choice-of-anchor B domain-containing protein
MVSNQQSTFPLRTRANFRPSVIYRGPHKEYYGQEICFGYNEDTLTIYDTTNKQKPIVISETPYIGNAYSHQGWIVDEAMTTLLLDDELDELNQAGPPAGELGGLVNHTTTYIFDISNLEAPVNTGFYQSPETSIDHNQYVSHTGIPAIQSSPTRTN